MHSFTAFIALAALAHAAPVAQKEAPDHYYEGYLEPYMTYHTRYITIGCAGQQDTQFFTDCCSPMLADEKLETARLPYCIPNATESASASAWEASASASPVPQTESADYEAQSAYANYATSEVATSTTEAPAPSSTWSPEPAPETTQAPAPSNDEHTGGFATYFHQNGNPGACGNYNQDSGLGVAIDHEIWGSDFSGGSEYCGRQIKVSRGDRSVTATVWDVCPTCANGNSLDLSVAAFNSIASESEGMVPITWSWA